VAENLTTSTFSKRRILEILDRGKIDDKVSRGADSFLALLIVSNVIAISLESVDSIGHKYAEFFFYFEIFSTFIFSSEYLMQALYSNRLYPSRR
jgi:voltage-gated potassium channel